MKNLFQRELEELHANLEITNQIVRASANEAKAKANQKIEAIKTKNKELQANLGVDSRVNIKKVNTLLHKSEEKFMNADAKIKKQFASMSETIAANVGNSKTNLDTSVESAKKSIGESLEKIHTKFEKLKAEAF